MTRATSSSSRRPGATGSCRPLKPGSQRRVIDSHFFETEYAKAWTAFLRSPELTELAARTGRTVAFLPHPNIQPVLAKMDLPDSVLRLSFDGADVQEYFARSAVLVTDYSSMAFNAAYMDRPVVYFQFDAAAGHGRRARRSGRLLPVPP